MNRRIYGALAIGAGVVGIIVCLALIVGIWVGRNAANEMVVALAAGVNGGLVRATAALGEVQTRIDGARTRVADLNAQIERMAQGDTPGSEARDRLILTIDEGVGADYARFREAYITTRERVGATAENLGSSRLLARWLNLDNLPVEQVQTVDSTLTTFDAALVGMRQDLATRDLPLARLAGRLAERTAPIESSITALSTAVDEITARLEQIRTSVQSLAATVQGWITIAAVVLSLLCLYIAFLHVLLFLQGRIWYSSAAEPAPLPA